MLIFPAIDLRGGRCVRLTKGDFNQETVYGEDPAAVAREFERAGAKWIHVVDLDAARDGILTNGDAIRQIVESVRIPVQMGGGMRSFEAVSAMLEIGVSRVVVGSALVHDPGFAELIFRHFGARIVAGIDARDGIASVSGWKESGGIDAKELARRVVDQGACRIIFTDVGRDGMLTGPNLEALTEMIAAVPVPVIASGGVGDLLDIEALAHLQPVAPEGVIVGKALYDHRLTLEEAIQAAQTAKS